MTAIHFKLKQEGEYQIVVLNPKLVCEILKRAPIVSPTERGVRMPSFKL